MGITAKELAKKLGLSETAISMALNNKPGVSTQTRQAVISLAEQCAYKPTTSQLFSHFKDRSINKINKKIFTLIILL